ncbi:MAG: thioredoxin, partial [Sphingomonadales bacterium]
MATRYELADFEEAIEFYHRSGWTDGLPIVPPTPERVAQFLEAAGLKAEDQLGFYEERRLPIIAEKVAINAVMAGCLPEYFPVVVAIVEAMLEPGFMLHVANSSTGSFTLGFLVNGPIRNAIGMNCHGNMLGPGNRANSSIGRAIRLIQLNVMGSIPGAGGPDPAHGRAVLDRSMMGQPAKYAGYHLVENEEEFPSLTPTHVELGFDAGDSTVTMFLIAGHHWTDLHAEQTPEAWIDTMAQYVVGTGKLTPSGYGILLLPPE